MSVTNLPPVLRQRYFDSNGVPLAGGQIFTYQAGTTTPQATYTDQTGNTPNANPIILDSQGYASMWLDPTLSYKFVLKDASNNVQWTVDNVVGLLTANAVNTSAIQDGAVTSAKLAAGSVNTAALASDASVDANRPVNTNSIRDGAITRQKINSTAIVPVTVQTFNSTSGTSGVGTYYPTYAFFCASANATSGATYTNNGQTYTVSKTIAGGTVLTATGTGAPLSSGTLTKASGTGDATIAFTLSQAPIYIKVTAIGPGAGGGGASTGYANGGAPTGPTTFGTTLISAGAGGAGSAGGTSGNGGAGGTSSLGSAIGIAVTGSTGSPSATNTTAASGGNGGSSAIGGAGLGGLPGLAAGAAGSNSGSGGGGGGAGGGTVGGGGGGAGGYVHALITPVSASYAYSIPAGGTAGAGANAGGAGGGGFVMVEEYFQ